MKNLITYLVNTSAIIVLILPFNILLAQDGEALFKAKCNACHIMGKDGTGPNLQGIKAKWEGEEEFLYEWVVNSPKVIAEGLSERAQEVKDWSPTVMPPQDVTIEEAVAIIDFTDSWEPEVVEETPGDETLDNVVIVPDYKRNLKLFYILIGVIFILLIAIRIVSKSTAAIIRSDLFREKISERNNGNSNVLKTVAVLLFASLWSTGASALSIEKPQFTNDENVWLYVESSDLYVLLIIALLLLGFLLHTVNMFFNMIRVIKPKIEVAEEEQGPSFTRILTGATPVEEEHKIDLGHDYDGIRELDNPMPPWWLAGFFISIVFAVVYMFHYHVLGTGDLQHEEYEKSVAAAEIEAQAYREKMAMNIDETNATMMSDPSDLKTGKELYLNNCAVCHQENGEGEVGPNLTDDYWIYGGEIGDIYKVIRKGAPNGMPEHQSKFNPIQIQQVASYVLTLDYVSPEKGGKEPEGDKVEGIEDSTQDEIDDAKREDVTDDSIAIGLVDEVDSLEIE